MCSRTASLPARSLSDAFTRVSERVEVAADEGASATAKSDAGEDARGPAVEETCAAVLPLKWNSGLPVKLVLVVEGHQNFSMCSTTRSVPRKWFTNGRMREQYIVSVRSRTRRTFLPSCTSWRIAKERPSTHMLAWTPMT